MTKNRTIDAPKDNPDNDLVIHALTQRRAELAGMIDHLDSKVAQSKADIRHIDAVLSMWGFDAPHLKIRAKVVGTAGLFHRGELPRECMKLLRASETGMTATELAFEVSRNRAWETDDKRFQVALAEKINRSLDKARRHGRVASERLEGGVLWKRAD